MVSQTQNPQNSTCAKCSSKGSGGLKKHDLITEARMELHRLPVEARLKFKIVTLTWKALNDMGPPYIKKTL